MREIMQDRNMVEIPRFLQPFLWSYDLSRLGLEKHKNIIIKNILNMGNRRATDWLKKQYSEDEIQEVIRTSILSDWSKKSINLWTLIYKVAPKKTRF